MKISILTSTYNRKHLLPKLYKSLVENSKTFTNFEWLIMDDGSSDNTESLVKDWIKENKIKIKYYKQKNAGKMAAINNLSKYVTGEIWIEVDSDDYFIDGVLKDISKDYETLDKKAYGILYYRKILNVETPKDESLNNKIISLYHFHYKYGYTYDTSLTFRTSVRKNFKYELEHNEKFITEARTYYKMDLVSKGLLISNKDVIIANYEEDGYTKGIVNLFKKYPYGYYEFFKELLNYPKQDILFKQRLYMVKHYILFSVLTKIGFTKSVKHVKIVKNKIMVMLLYFLGMVKTKIKFRG